MKPRKPLSFIRLQKLASQFIANKSKKEMEIIAAYLKYVFTHKNDEL